MGPRQSSDWSRDRIDAERQTWTQITGRKVQYTGAGLAMVGPVNRPDAQNLVKRRLPDGTFEYVSYLKPGAQLTDRYKSGQPDVIPFTEASEFVPRSRSTTPCPLRRSRRTCLTSS